MVLDKLMKILGIALFSFALVACGDEADLESANSGDEVQEVEIEELINKDEIPEVIATVNGEDISKETYIANLGNMVLPQEIDVDSEEATQMVESMKEQLLDRIINERIMLQAAEKEGIEVSDEDIDEMLLPVTSQFESEEELKETLDQENVTMDELRADVARLLTIDQYIEKHMQDEEISDEELKEAYEEVVATSEDSEIPPFEEYKDVIKAKIEYEKQEEQINQLVEELRENSEVVIHI